MNKINLLLLIAFLLSSCAPAATATIPTVTLQLTSTSTSTPAPTATQTPSPTPTLVPTPTKIGGGSGRLIFDLQKMDFAKPFPNLKGDLNIFTSNADGTDLIPVTDGLRGYNYLQSISSDGSKVLIASATDLEFHGDKHPALYSINLNSVDSEPIQLASGITKYAVANQAIHGKGSIAKWINNTSLVYIGDGDSGFGIYTVNSDGTNLNNIYKYNNDSVAHKPAEILAINGTRVYWDSEVVTSLGGNRSESKSYAWWSSIDGSDQGSLDFNGKHMVFDRFFTPLIFSPDGSKLAWMEPATHTFHHNYLHIASVSDLDGSSQLDIESSFPVLTWERDGSQLLVFDDDETFGARNPNSDLFGLYTVSASQPLSVKNAHRSDVLDVLTSATWLGDISPDGRQILVYRQYKTTWWANSINILNLETMTFSEVLSGYILHDVHWLP